MDIGLSLNGIALASQMQGGGGGGGGPAPQSLQPLSGVLDAANVVLLGASIFEAAFETGSNVVTPAVQAYATAAGFTGTLRSYAQSGDRISDTITRFAQAKADLTASEGNNIYITHTGGNNVSTARPYPGGAGTFQSHYDLLMGDITATDAVIPLPLTKRLYGIDDPAYPAVTNAVVQGDAPSEANGSKPYNDATILPVIASYAPDWQTPGGGAYVDPYAFVDADPQVLGFDGVHGPGTALARYVLAKVAGRAMGRATNTSRAGQSIIYNIRSGDPNGAAIGALNLIQGFPNGTQNNPLFYGAIAQDGSFDPHIRARMTAFRNGSFGMDASCYPRLADSRFHDLSLVSAGLYVQGTDTFTLQFDDLTPGDSVTISCCGVRTAGGTNRSGDISLSDGQVLTLNASNGASSNQVVFNPTVVPANGRITLTLTVTPGSTYGYLHGLILDFAP